MSQKFFPILIFEYVRKLLISTAGGRFPRAKLQPPCASHYGVSRLMLFQQESPPSVPINYAVLCTLGHPDEWSLKWVHEL